MTTSYSVRADKSIIDKAKEVACSYGLDLASVTRALWAQIGRTGEIPLDFSRERPSSTSMEAIRETEEMIRTGSGEAFTSVDDFVAALKA